MSWLDWLIMVVPIVVVATIGVYTRRYMRSVADFMAGGRNAGRYLICTARSEMGSGAVVFVAMFEMFYNAGFTYTWWSYLTIPAGLIVSITGFVIYRYRQTRALTVAQFFEMRYSRRFRLFTGGLAFIAGILNFGIIPIIGARFFVHFLDLPPMLHLGTFVVPTQLMLMACFLSVTVLMTLAGGQIAVLVTDCAEGLISQVFYLIIIAALILMFSWSQMTESLLTQPPGESLVNPFDSFSIKGFNIWYVLMSVFVFIYGTMAWQNAHAFNSAAATPHEARMGGILGRWREFARGVMITLLAMAAITYLRHEHFAAGAQVVHDLVNQMPDANTQRQMLMPTALAHLLPMGIKGLLCSIILMGVVSGDGMHLHSWGSILIQDVILPLRKVAMTPRQHIRMLRWSVIGVAAFAFCFGALFTQTDYVVMWFQVTTAIYVGGAGAAIIGGLYWSRGTTAGAWAGLLTGSILSAAGILLQQKWVWAAVSGQLVAWFPNSQFLQDHLDEFPFNGMVISFYATLAAVAAYVIVSMTTCRVPHDMDRLLHRGQYAVESDRETPDAQPRTRSLVARLMGIDEEFTRVDRWIAGGIFWWSMAWFFIFIVGSAAYLIHPWSDMAWAHYWGFAMIWLPLIIGVITTVWFTIGGVRDLRIFFQRLRNETSDVSDDGTVEKPAEPAPAPDQVPAGQ